MGYRKRPVVMILLLAASFSLQHWSTGAFAADASHSLRADLLTRPVSPELGGQTTVAVTGERAFQSVAANAQGMSVARFTFGQQLFKTVWEPAPGSQPTTDGLGPLFNRPACLDCHVGNGRGQPPANPGDTMDSMLVRLSIPGTGEHGGPNPVPLYGGQLQDRGIDGVPAEGKAVIRYAQRTGQYADGTEYSLLEPSLEFDDLGYGKLPRGLQTSARVASPVIGLGLLEAVPESTLHALADPEDENGDGISGRVNVVWDAVGKTTAVGRFGWKANMPSLRQQTAGAALGDMGITSPIFPEDQCMPGQEACVTVAAAVADPPEIVQPFFDPLVTYTQLVAVPRQRAEAPGVDSGAALFRAIDCANCHLPTLVTSAHALPELSDQVIHPFTDLLLHDMGDALADGRSDFEATGSEWRTPPLWGIGLTGEVGGFNRFLHDGRARSLEEAILWHGGEAEGARDKFVNLDRQQRTDLLAFLKSL